MVSFSVNSPIPSDVGTECRKCADIIDHFVKPEKSKGPDQLIPVYILAQAKGIAIITVIKAGFIFSGRGGSGLVLAKLPDGSWSAPSAIGTAGMGVGGQIGAEITDFVIILNTDDAVRAFSMGGNVTLGGNLSVAAGPFGRNAEAGGAIGSMSAIYSYSKTKGLFAGISIEGSVIVERKETNAAFYGVRHSARDILSGTVAHPPAASVLYRALDRRLTATASTNNSSGMSSENFDRRTSTPSTIPSHHTLPHDALRRSSDKGFNPHTTASFPAAASGSTFGVSADTTSTGLRKPPPLPPALPKRPATARALYDFTGEQSTDLAFTAGDMITITRRTDTTEGWWEGECHGRKGEFPGNYVEIL
ncbi:hypothetical protein BASA60_008980 [Batrachochytrium salamandrivorans]|nr:hypothetical protein BASA60_008980 [Batrachochytrium salamandrivorans]KAH9255867.1 hypothetical protein BASA81_006041 [Batrachochytrium salamandrivorans]